MTLLQLMGVIVPVISLIGAIAAITGVILLVVKFMMFFQRDSIIVFLCSDAIATGQFHPAHYNDPFHGKPNRRR